jgi:hypothetical protein
MRERHLPLCVLAHNRDSGMPLYTAPSDNAALMKWQWVYNRELTDLKLEVQNGLVSSVSPLARFLCYIFSFSS